MNIIYYTLNLTLVFIFKLFFSTGATALDKKSKKQFDAAVLEGLGAKKAKAVKMPTNMAIGMY
jgi:hypothetical protein